MAARFIHRLLQRFGIGAVAHAVRCLVHRAQSTTEAALQLLEFAFGQLTVFAFGGLQALNDPVSVDLLRWATAFDSPWRFGSVFLGAASVLMLWSVLYTRRSWLMFIGLLMACPLVTWWLP